MTTMSMPTDDLLSPASKLLSPVTRLDKAKSIMNEEQQKRMAALPDDRIRKVMAKDPIVTRVLRRPTGAAGVVQHKSSTRYNHSAPTTQVPSEAPAHQASRRVQMRTLSVESTSAEHDKALELERSYELLRRLDDADIRAKRREEAVKKNVVPTSNYHLKHYGLADADRINIYAPFEGTTSLQHKSTKLASQSEGQPRQPKLSISASVDKGQDVVDEVPVLMRRKTLHPPATESRRTPPAPQGCSPNLLSSHRKATKQQPRAGRSTPMKARLRARHPTSTFPWTGLGYVVLGAGIASLVATFVLILAQDRAFVDSVASFGTSTGKAVVQGTISLLDHRYVLLAGLLAALALLLWLSQGLSASDERTIDRLVVCAKEELLLHATSNLPGHTAIPEAYLREAILDLLGYKGAKRVQADSLWPSVRQILGADSRIQCFQARSKRGMFLWEWIAPQSEVAMNRYAAAVTSLRNERN